MVAMILVAGFLQLNRIQYVIGSQNYTRSAMLNSLFDGYDKKLPPTFDRPLSEQQVVISTNMYIISMFSFSEVNMDYSMSMFLRQRWTDKRLAYDDKSNLSRLELDPISISKVWVPDMFIMSEKHSDFHEVTVPNLMMHVYPDGIVQYSMRVTGTFTCLMRLQKYPFDTQECNFEVESYGMSTDQLQFEWSEDPVRLAKGIQLPQFDLIKATTHGCAKNHFGVVFPCIGITFVLTRRYGYYLTQIYVPSVLIVMISWVSFWLDCNSTPARISLGLLTVLTMTTQSSGARSNLPRVSYIKAIDVWMAMCLIFVSMALLEFAYVSVQSRVWGRRKDDQSVANLTKWELNQLNAKTDSKVATSPGLKLIYAAWMKKFSGLERGRAVDKVARVLFPASFVLFNTFYWLFYFEIIHGVVPLVPQDTA